MQVCSQRLTHFRKNSQNTMQKLHSQQTQSGPGPDRTSLWPPSFDGYPDFSPSATIRLSMYASVQFGNDCVVGKAG